MIWEGNENYSVKKLFLSCNKRSLLLKFNTLVDVYRVLGHVGLRIKPLKISLVVIAVFFAFQLYVSTTTVANTCYSRLIDCWIIIKSVVDVIKNAATRYKIEWTCSRRRVENFIVVWWRWVGSRRRGVSRRGKWKLYTPVTDWECFACFALDLFLLLLTSRWCRVRTKWSDGMI